MDDASEVAGQLPPCLCPVCRIPLSQSSTTKIRHNGCSSRRKVFIRVGHESGPSVGWVWSHIMSFRPFSFRPLTQRKIKCKNPRTVSTKCTVNAEFNFISGRNGRSRLYLSAANLTAIAYIYSSLTLVRYTGWPKKVTHYD